MLEATAVEPRGRISPFDLGLWSDEQIPGLRRIAEFLKSQGAVAAIQLAHAGRKASTGHPSQGGGVLRPEAGGWQTVGPSAIPFHASDPAPHALTVEEIAGIPGVFAAAAARALEAGIEVVEIHGAHGYLLHQFLSPIANQRMDEYGGAFDNRARLALEVTEAVRKVWPEKLPLWFRVSAQDWVEGGRTLEESVELARRLKPLGVDLIDVSSGGMSPHAKIKLGPGYQVPFAEAIRKGAEIPTGAVGMITEAAQAEAILEQGQADVVLLAREFLRDPYWPLHAAVKLGVRPAAPSQYLRAFL
jgi:2,4-dienoyl-CoA reductase-like NADH-dependent reductase (Old Yellow Enzyme family)